MHTVKLDNLYVGTYSGIYTCCVYVTHSIYAHYTQLLMFTYIQIVNLFYRYVSFYVNTIKSSLRFNQTLFIMSDYGKVTADRLVLIAALTAQLPCRCLHAASWKGLRCIIIAHIPHYVAQSSYP